MPIWGIEHLAPGHHAMSSPDAVESSTHFEIFSAPRDLRCARESSVHPGIFSARINHISDGEWLTGALSFRKCIEFRWAHRVSRSASGFGGRIGLRRGWRSEARCAAKLGVHRTSARVDAQRASTLRAYRRSGGASSASTVHHASLDAVGTSCVRLFGCGALEEL